MISPFTDPSPDAAREVFARKPRGLVDKRMSVSQAIRQLVNDGDYLGIGGFGTNRIPTAAIHEMLRQQKQNLGFAGHTATHDFQLLCTGNLTHRGQTLSRVDIAYIVGLEARGLSPHARRVIESGTVQCIEWTNYALALRLQAAAMGVSFLPTRSLAGTDTFRYSAATTIICPFGVRPRVRAITCVSHTGRWTVSISYEIVSMRCATLVSTTRFPSRVRTTSRRSCGATRPIACLLMDV